MRDLPRGVQERQDVEVRSEDVSATSCEYDSYASKDTRSTLYLLPPPLLAGAGMAFALAASACGWDRAVGVLLAEGR